MRFSPHVAYWGHPRIVFVGHMDAVRDIKRPIAYFVLLGLAWGRIVIEDKA
jgi:hypothetical protein